MQFYFFLVYIFAVIEKTNATKGQFKQTNRGVGVRYII